MNGSKGHIMAEYKQKHFPHGFVRARDIVSEDYKWEVITSLDECPLDADAIFLSGRGSDQTRGWETLPDRTRISTVMYFQAQRKHLEVVARMPSLKRLSLLQPKEADISPIAALNCLEVLFIEDATKGESLEFVRPLRNLKALGVFDAKRLVDISGIEDLTGLDELGLQRGIWNAMKLKTLQPLSGLTGLSCLRLTAESEDNSLEPLRNLSNLQELELNLLYPMGEYARLAAFLPEEICEVFAEPYETVGGLCKKESGHMTILPAWPLKRWCNDCNPEKLDASMSEYRGLRDATRARGAWVYCAGQGLQAWRMRWRISWGGWRVLRACARIWRWRPGTRWWERRRRRPRRRNPCARAFCLFGRRARYGRTS